MKKTKLLFAGLALGLVLIATGITLLFMNGCDDVSEETSVSPSENLTSNSEASFNGDVPVEMTDFPSENLTPDSGVGFNGTISIPMDNSSVNFTRDSEADFYKGKQGE
jgi:hypothetical protein